ncbi:MAG TPA: 50S ribosomal protein L21 [Alphaproteobacteria bacterium]|nr:50S ribosomal protein L21 [Alphaproteobacteria bacterium]
MFAVIKTGGKQYKVSQNDILEVEKLNAQVGETVRFNEVIAIESNNQVTLGKPTVANAAVAAEVLEQFKDDKILVFKKKRRHNYRRKNGHRQLVTKVKITAIEA